MVGVECMQSKYNFGILALFVAIYSAWKIYLPVQVDAVHQSGSFSDVLVKNFPLTDQGRISWWNKHRALLKEKYDIPRPEEDGSFDVVIWEWDGVYKTDKGNGDDLCFKDMKEENNCIEKKKRKLWITRMKSGGYRYEIGVGSKAVYYQVRDGGRVKRKD